MIPLAIFIPTILTMFGAALVIALYYNNNNNRAA